MKRFSAVSKELSPVQSLTQFLIDVGVRSMIAIKADDSGREHVSLEQLDSMVMARPISFCTERITDSSRVWSVVPLYIEGERHILKSAEWDPFLKKEVNLVLKKEHVINSDKRWTIPFCRYKIDERNGGLRPGTFAWWVPASRFEPHEP